MVRFLSGCRPCSAPLPSGERVSLRAGVRDGSGGSEGESGAGAARVVRHAKEKFLCLKHNATFSFSFWIFFYFLMLNIACIVSIDFIDRLVTILNLFFSLKVF